MKLYKFIAPVLSAGCFIFLIVACQEEFNPLGTDIVGQINFETLEVNDLDVVAFSRSFPEGVQTNGLPVGSIGFYRDNIYGNSLAQVVSQLQLSRQNPDFGDSTVVDSVVFTLPYFSSVIDNNSDGGSDFELDSVFGNAPMNLTVFRSNFFLDNLDPDTNFEDPAVFTSNDLAEFEGLEGDLLFGIDSFVPSPEEIVLTSISTNDQKTVTRIGPALRVVLDNDYWNQEIIQREGQKELLTQNTFNDFFRGIFFQIEPINDNGSFILFDYAGADITIYYSFTGFDDTPNDDGGAIPGTGSISFGLVGGINVVGYENDFNTAIFQDIANVDEINGEENLYLKGGEGSIALIDLFGPDIDENGVADQLEILRSCNVIINEANLTFFVDQPEVAIGSGEPEPERVFIYDFDTRSVLIDAIFDISQGDEGPVSAQTNHFGRLVREDEGNTSSPGVSYRLRLTRHLNNIINEDSTNTRLALSVSQNVLQPTTAIIGGTGNAEDALRVPVSGVISPEGTVLHGNLSEDQERRLRLSIFYTLTEEIDPNSPCGQLLGL